MGRRRTTRGRGRPSTDVPAVTREAILEAALALLERGGLAAVTMRALARELSVDPMAAYHYFRDKDALLAAAAEWAYSTLRVRMPASADWRRRLTLLAKAYVRFLRRSGELLRYVAARSSVAGGAAPHFDALFLKAVEPLRLDERRRSAARDAFVDLLHGFSLSGEAVSEPTLDAELEVLFAGMKAFSSRR